VKIKLIYFLLLPLFCFAQIPSYYNKIDFSKKGDDLKIQLTNLITTTHITNIPYTATNTIDDWDALSQTDVDPNNNNNVLLIYGYNDTDTALNNDRSRDKTLQCHTISCSGFWVREHTYPRSLGTPNLGYDLAGSDAHHLRAIDSQMNSSRSNRMYDSGIGSASITTNSNWYPGDEWKGDIARMMMYMYVRYPAQCLPTAVGVGSTSYSNFGDMPNLFLDWNQQDHVSQYELNRNNILETIQGNRNPFIDNPYLATKIWNGIPATDTWGLLSIQSNINPNSIIYPSITNDCIFILNPTNKTYLYSIFNTLGQLIKSSNTKNEIDLSEVPKGIYFVNLSNDGQNNNFKIIRN
jgi:endonuclease I